jgi:hypothetical protein
VLRSTLKRSRPSTTGRSAVTNCSILRALSALRQSWPHLSSRTGPI